jgi:hypothetical protein
MVGEGDQVMPLQQCRYGCNTMIEVKQTPEGWRPFEDNGDMHDCPKSPYNQKKQQGDSYRTPKGSALSDFETRVLNEMENMNKKLDSIISGRSFVDPEIEE